MNFFRSFWLWLAAVVLLVTVATWQSPTANSTTARIAHLESVIRCPSCDGLSVAQSTQSSSLAIRGEISSMVRAGTSDSAIISTIEKAYGPSILLSPSTSGVGVVLWAGPVLVVLGALAIGARLGKRR